jgi:integrase/recombinase XerD
MTAPGNGPLEILPAGRGTATARVLGASPRPDLPAVIADDSPAAVFAWDEFFAGELANRHTRVAYLRAVKRFLAWCECQGVSLTCVTPGLVGTYFDRHTGSIPTRKQHLAALRKFFDRLVVRHVLVLNPAASVRAERYRAVEGKTPEFPVEAARRLLASLRTDTLVGLRDRAVIGTLIYTAVRVGAVARLRVRDFTHDGSQWVLRFTEKGGKSREIPVRHDLERFLHEYLDAAGLRQGPAGGPVFRTAAGRTGKLTEFAMSAVDVCRMVKRRLHDAGLPNRLSPHSFRVTTITDLLEQGVPLEDVQYLAGHADPRTTRLYDRRQKRITRNIVERISV